MQSNQPYDSPQRNTNPWLRRFWAVLPTLFVILLLLIGIGMAIRITEKGEALKAQKAAELRQEQTTVNVVALNLSPIPMKESISLPGVVRPWISLRVVSEIRGKVIAKSAAQGQSVSEGQIIARIDDRDYRNAYASAKAAFQAAKASHDRIKALVKDRLATQSQLDDVVAQMETTQASMDTAALNLERCVIRSPMNGVVDNLPIEVGRYLNVGDPVADLLQVDRLKVEVGIPESDVAAVRRIGNFRITVDALDGKVYQGKFHFLSKSTSNTAMLYKLEIALDNTDGLLLPDMFARVDIVKKSVDQGLAIPLFALMDDGAESRLFIVNDEKAHERKVATGIQDGWLVQITDGLRPGDRVIVVGQRGLNDNDPVNVVRSVNSVEELNQ